MLEAIGSRWWLFLLRGIAAILFGILAFAWPGLTLLTLVVVFAIYAIFDGVFAIATAIMGTENHRWWLLLLGGIVSIVAGLVVLNYPLMSATVFVYFLAVWAIMTGIAEILFGVQLRDAIKDEWLYVLGGIVSIIFGVWVLREPVAGALAEVWLIAMYALIFGIIQVVLSFRLKALHARLGQAAS